MYQALIVDDEIHIAQGIKSTIDWKQFGMEGVHVAYNIKQAKEYFTSGPIDILICDIEMPEGDGFELLSWVKAKYPNTQSMFLTCHADFEYAQKALQMGSLDYILKPVPRDKLEKAVSKAIKEIEKSRELAQFNQVYTHFHRLWTEHQPLLIERFWIDLLEQRIPADFRSTAERLRMLNLALTQESRFMPVLISVQRWLKELNTRETKIMEYAVRKMAEEMLLTNGRSGQTVTLDKGKFLLILHSNETQESSLRVKAECSTFIGACNQYLFCHLSCYVGRSVPIQEVKSLYDQLITLDEGNVTSVNAAFLCDDAEKRNRRPAQFDLPDMNLWLELLTSGDRSGLRNQIATCLDEWKRKEGLHRSALQLLGREWMLGVYRIFKEKGISAEWMSLDLAHSDKLQAATRSVLDLEEWALELADGAWAILKESHQGKSLVEKIQIYIGQHLEQNISRQTLADAFYLSPDYLGKVFKQEAGISIVDYVTHERVERAKALLANTEISVSDIALRVGYDNFSYFSKIFRKVVGVSPQEFRKSFFHAKK